MTYSQLKQVSAQGEGARVVFATYQSSPRVAEVFALDAPRFDLAIADKAHRRGQHQRQHIFEAERSVAWLAGCRRLRVSCADSAG